LKPGLSVQILRNKKEYMYGE
jgi:hypothetical protein